jgi:SagB-type dehydrogenase family enzyme
MIDKEVAIVSIVFLFALLGIYLLFFSPTDVESLGPVSCSINPEQSEIFLPMPNTSDVHLEEAIKDSVDMSFDKEYLSLGELSQVLWAGAGVVDETGTRTVHSASNLYPIEVYVVPNMIRGASCGIYHYEPDEHKLVLVREGSFSKDIQKAAYGKTYAGEAGAAIVLSAVPDRASKFGELGAEKFIHIEAGAITQNMLLESGAIGIGAIPVDSFSQDFVDLILGVDGYKEKSVYMTLIGKKKKEKNY